MAYTHSSTFSRVRVDSAGRVVIPSDLRGKLGIEPGQELILTEEPCGLKLQTFRQALAAAQAFFAPYRRSGQSIVDELIADRRAEAAHEEEDG